MQAFIFLSSGKKSLQVDFYSFTPSRSRRLLDANTNSPPLNPSRTNKTHAQ